ncbi:MAG TPA: mechanosensitive ion channel domain-containing protein [Vicinamibacterales bacterium]|nr:mechanosensitive ion channel domain-containing protein [Vicinamibacterales bacterium]
MSVWFALASTADAQPAPNAGPTPAPAPSELVETLPASQSVVFTYMNRPITTLRARVLTDTPADRASAATAILDRLVDQDMIGPVSAPVINGVLFLRVGTADVLHVASADVNRPAGETLEQRGVEARGRLAVALDEARELRRPNRLLSASLRAAAVTLLFVTAIVMLARARRRTVARVHAVAWRNLDRMAGRWWTNRDVWAARVAGTVVTATLIALGLLLTYWWVAFVLRQFPYSRPWGESLRGQLLAMLAAVALAIAHAIPNLLLVALIVAGTRAAISISSAFFDAVERGTIAPVGTSPETARASRRLLAAGLWLIAAVLAYPYIPGSGTDAFKGVSVFVGVIMSLGSAGLVNQLMSGLTLTYSRGLRVGDVVRTGEVSGRVARMGIFSLQLRTFRGELITVPNAVVIGQSMTNYTRTEGTPHLSLDTEVTIGYSTPWRQVQALLTLAAQRTDMILRDPPPKVLQRSLEDFYVRYQLIVALDCDASHADVLNDLLANIQDAFNEHGVQIMSPNYEADPVHPVVVPRDQWYTSPANPPRHLAAVRERP